MRCLVCVVWLKYSSEVTGVTRLLEHLGAQFSIKQKWIQTNRLGSQSSMYFGLASEGKMLPWELDLTNQQLILVSLAEARIVAEQTFQRLLEESKVAVEHWVWPGGYMGQRGPAARGLAPVLHQWRRVRSRACSADSRVNWSRILPSDSIEQQNLAIWSFLSAATRC